jgi:hypothetical protein
MATGAVRDAVPAGYDAESVTQPVVFGVAVRLRLVVSDTVAGRISVTAC